jgi:hypothetical protein
MKSQHLITGSPLFALQAVCANCLERCREAGAQDNLVHYGWNQTQHAMSPWRGTLHHVARPHCMVLDATLR